MGIEEYPDADDYPDADTCLDYGHEWGEPEYGVNLGEVVSTQYCRWCGEERDGEV